MAKMPPDEDFLAAIRLLPCCTCGQKPPSEPSHIFTRGMGGGSRYDIAENVVPQCRGCHVLWHHGKIKRAVLLTHAGKRCGKSAEQCYNVVRKLLFRRE